MTGWAPARTVLWAGGGVGSVDSVSETDGWRDGRLAAAILVLARFVVFAVEASRRGLSWRFASATFTLGLARIGGGGTAVAVVSAVATRKPILRVNRARSPRDRRALLGVADATCAAGAAVGA